MRKFSVLVFPIFLIFFGCTKDSSNIAESGSEKPLEEPIESGNKVYFIFNTLVNYIDAENWIILHDQNGKLLDYKKYEYGEIINFEKPQAKIDSIQYLNITLSHHLITNGDYYIHEMNTYTGIDIYTNWDNVPDPVLTNKNNSISDYNFILNNISGIYSYYISTNTGDDFGEYINQNIDFYKKENLKFNDNEEYLFVITELNGKQKYKYFETNPLQLNLSFDYVDFKDYDEKIEIDIPENKQLYWSTHGYKNSDFTGGRFFVSGRNTFNNSSNITLGYLNNLNSYDTSFGIQLNEYGYYFRKFGGKPNTFTIPEKPIFNVLNKSLGNFKFSSTFDFQWFKTRWNFNNYNDTNRDQEPTNIFWSIVGEANNINVIIGEIPEEIKGSYPTLNVEKLTYNATDLYYSSSQHINSYNYKYFIDGNFKSYSNTTLQFQFEYITIYNDESLHQD